MAGCSDLFYFGKQSILVTVNSQRLHILEMSAGFAFHPLALAASAVIGHPSGLIEDRKANPKEGSYTNYLFDKGIDKILKKVGEEAAEIIIAAKNPNTEEVKYEMADFLYHAMVLMVEKGLTWDDIVGELADR